MVTVLQMSYSNNTAKAARAGPSGGRATANLKPPSRFESRSKSRYSCQPPSYEATLAYKESKHTELPKEREPYARLDHRIARLASFNSALDKVFNAGARASATPSSTVCPGTGNAYDVPRIPGNLFPSIDGVERRSRIHRAASHPYHRRMEERPARGIEGGSIARLSASAPELGPCELSGGAVEERGRVVASGIARYTEPLQQQMHLPQAMQHMEGCCTSLYYTHEQLLQCATYGSATFPSSSDYGHSTGNGRAVVADGYLCEQPSYFNTSRGDPCRGTQPRNALPGSIPPYPAFSDLREQAGGPAEASGEDLREGPTIYMNAPAPACLRYPYPCMTVPGEPPGSQGSGETLCAGLGPWWSSEVPAHLGAGPNQSGCAVPGTTPLHDQIEIRNNEAAHAAQLGGVSSSTRSYGGDVYDQGGYTHSMADGVVPAWQAVESFDSAQGGLYPYQDGSLPLAVPSSQGATGDVGYAPTPSTHPSAINESATISFEHGINQSAFGAEASVPVAAAHALGIEVPLQGCESALWGWDGSDYQPPSEPSIVPSIASQADAPVSWETDGGTSAQGQCYPIGAYRAMDVADAAGPMPLRDGEGETWRGDVHTATCYPYGMGATVGGYA
ncbi:hypothetical protein C8Q77DRAFT_221970 [Trametes polyzona]|nr:hypothetical protein C8Q77DRAFT_221970 [Trametes polyzona]